MDFCLGQADIHRVTGASGVKFLAWAGRRNWTNTPALGRDFAIAQHSGNGEWEYLYAVGALQDDISLFPARVKIQVAGETGVIA